MTITHPVATRNALADLVVDRLDLGTPPGVLELGTTGFATTIMSCTLSNPAAGAAASGTATFNAISQGTAVAAGTAAEFHCRRGDGGAIEFQGSVTTTGGGGDMELSSIVFAINDQLDLSSGTYTAPA